MKKIYGIFGLMALLLFSMVTMVGCPDPNTGTTTTTVAEKGLVGYWKSSFGDGFEIVDGNKIVYYQYDDASKAKSFAGEIVNSSSLSSESGFITIKITETGSWGKTVNEYLVIRWKNFATNVCKQATPYKASGKSTCTTQTEAESEFTEANGYYGLFGEYTKQ